MSWVPTQYILVIQNSCSSWISCTLSNTLIISVPEIESAPRLKHQNKNFNKQLIWSLIKSQLTTQKNPTPSTLKYQIPLQTNLLRPMTKILMKSSNGHSSNHQENIHKHHNWPNTCIPWSFKVKLSLIFKDGGVQLVLPSANIYQQIRYGRHKNLSQQNIIKYLPLSSHWTPILSSLHQNKNIKNYQQHSKFIFLKMKLFLPLKKITCQTHCIHSNWQRILPFFLVLFESSTWRNWTQISKHCDILSIWWRVNYPKIPPWISSGPKWEFSAEIWKSTNKQPNS